MTTADFPPADWQTPDGSMKLYGGDVRAVLVILPNESVQMCIPSPPYWGLRDWAVGASATAAPQLFTENAI